LCILEDLLRRTLRSQQLLIVSRERRALLEDVDIEVDDLGD
jgi:hypothetical protein